MTQEERVLKHLFEKGKISQKGAIRLYSIYRLSARIYTLRKYGYNIETEYKTGKNRYGDKVTWAEYTLKGV
jgi:hypothetical protein